MIVSGRAVSAIVVAAKETGQGELEIRRVGTENSRLFNSDTNPYEYSES